MPPKELKSYVWNWILVLIISTLLFSVKLNQHDILSAKSILTIQAVVVIISGFLLFPDWNNKPGRFNITVWCLMLAMTTLLISVVYFADFQIALTAYKSALAVFFLSYFFHSVTRALMILFPSRPCIPWLVLCFMFLVSTLPVWIAPWIEHITDTTSELHSFLWVCPLSYLTSMIDYDYLRNQWFYQHTPFGMLRYEYPNTFYSSVLLAGVSLTLLRIDFPLLSDKKQ